jgi:hypothetical protein
MEATEIQNENAEMQQPQTMEEAQANPQGQPMPIPEKLTQQQALQVLVDAARIAQSKGLFTLDDAELVNKAIKAFMPPAGPVPSNG